MHLPGLFSLSSAPFIPGDPAANLDVFCSSLAYVLIHRSRGRMQLRESPFHFCFSPNAARLESQGHLQGVQQPTWGGGLPMGSMPKVRVGITDKPRRVGGGETGLLP